MDKLFQKIHQKDIEITTEVSTPKKESKKK
jgi:hypothetical protein